MAPRGFGTPEALDRPAARTGAVLVALLLFALAVHLPARMGNLYGEADTARLVNSALLWKRAGLRTEALSQYVYYTSPAYIWLITLLLPRTSGAMAPAAAALNAINLVAAVVITMPLYLLFRRIAGARAALIATLLLTIVPAFWEGGLYGFPTLPAALCMVMAVWLFDRWLLGDAGARAGGPTLAGCLLCLTAAILLKADVYLSAVALPGLVLYRRRWSWRTLVPLTLLLAAPVAVLYGVATTLLQTSPGAVAYAGTWSRTFPAEAQSAFTRDHALQVVKSFGLVSLPLFAVALVVLLRERQRILAALLVAWAVVPLAFWSVRPGDSARHHFQSTIPVALGVGILLARLRSPWRYAALVLVAAVNYWAFPATGSTVKTSGQLIQSGHLTARQVALDHRLAREFAELDQPRTAFLGTYTDPYVENQVLSLADSVIAARPVAGFDDAKEIRYLRGGRLHRSVIVSLSHPVSYDAQTVAALAACRAAGFVAYSMELYGDSGRRLSPAEARLSVLQLRN
jgi:hypothetical protein